MDVFPLRLRPVCLRGGRRLAGQGHRARPHPGTLQESYERPGADGHGRTRCTAGRRNSISRLLVSGFCPHSLCCCPVFWHGISRCSPRWRGDQHPYDRDALRTDARLSVGLELGVRLASDSRRHHLHFRPRLDRDRAGKFSSPSGLQFHDCPHFDHCHEGFYAHAFRPLNRTWADSSSAASFATIRFGEDIERMYVAQPIEWTDRGVVMLDQRRLPAEEIFYTYTDYREVAKAIREMVIRGAPAIGVAAAMGAALGVLHSSAKSAEALRFEFAEICETLGKTRPTAVDLFWALERMKRRFAELISETADLGKIRQGMVEEARQVHFEKRATDEAIGRFGAEFMPREGQVMTHCNAGALATGGIGTALGVIRVAFEQGRKIHVLVPETRPYLQGARLTAWELHRGGIPLTLITDNMVGHFLKTGKVGAIVTGADRIAANGDTANKIGTYQIAVLAKENNVPFYVAAPVSTFDLSIPDGEHIPIEERSATEVTHFQGVRIAPDVHAAHPAFDVTPARYIAAIFTERGVARAPYNTCLRSLAQALPENVVAHG